jgi:uncharacterized membrane protein YccF (DUF307 family)
MNLRRHPCDEEVQVREVQGMADTPIAVDIDSAAAVASPDQAQRERRMPLAFIVFGGVALVAQVLWLVLIGWWLLNLF